MIPPQILDQIPDKCVEGLILALASGDDGAIMEIRWCNKAFTKITGYTPSDVVGQRGTILIGSDLDQGTHLHIIENLMKWENFSTDTLNNRKNGEVYRQRMIWTHLTQPENGNHWWLCSITEPGDARIEPAKRTKDCSTMPWKPTHGNLAAKIHRLQKENARLYQLARSVAKDANEDALTGLSNRRHFEIELRSWIEKLTTRRNEFAVLYIDLDRFKFVNDTLGHDAGDRLLISVAKVLQELTAEPDLVARLGGDEFVILKHLGNSALNISNLADEIVQRLKAIISIEGKRIACSASVGVAIANADMEDPEQVVADADAALYQAKARGKGRWSFFTEKMHSESIATKQLASDLLLACERCEFTPYFQPLVDAKTGMIACAETLVRWLHPTKGILAPNDFLDVAANLGIIKRIDELIFAGLHKTLSRFDNAGIGLPRIAFNVSEDRLADPRFVHDIKSSGIQAERLTVEILESVYLDQMSEGVRWAINELSDLGITIALDDFGTGHASVRALLEIKPTILKIDRHFIQLVVEDPTARPLVASIIGIGKSLNMSVIAEGVETEEHAQALSEMGCDYLQGFYFGKPMSEEDLRNRLVETGGKFWQHKSEIVAAAKSA